MKDEGTSVLEAFGRVHDRRIAEGVVYPLASVLGMVLAGHPPKVGHGCRAAESARCLVVGPGTLGTHQHPAGVWRHAGLSAVHHRVDHPGGPG